MDGEKKKGFTYTVTQEQIDEYSRWPIERRLAWLYIGNKLRQSLPKKTREIQDLFRAGKL